MNAVIFTAGELGLSVTVDGARWGIIEFSWQDCQFEVYRKNGYCLEKVGVSDTLLDAKNIVNKLIGVTS